jgi:hypothetical protein
LLTQDEKCLAVKIERNFSPKALSHVVAKRSVTDRHKDFQQVQVAATDRSIRDATKDATESAKLKNGPRVRKGQRKPVQTKKSRQAKVRHEISS